MRVDRPESWLALHGFLVAFVWEMLQMPFYSMDGLSIWRITVNCTIASVGDAGIMVIAYAVASVVAKNRYWLHNRAALPLATYLGTGQVITIAVEFWALRSNWGWRYAEKMPELFGIGVVPLLMWIVVPLVALALAARSSKKLRAEK